MAEEKIRCSWANHSPLEQKYHDTEWGIPVHNDLKLFEMLILEGKQAGLSWSTILAKRASMRHAFDNFNPEKLIKYNDAKVEELLKNDGIIKNRLKVQAVIHNAKMYHKLLDKHGSLDKFLWNYTDGKTIKNSWADIKQVPASTPLSEQISKDLKKEGFKFVGATTMYAFMQAVGMVNDHLTYCFCYER